MYIGFFLLIIIQINKRMKFYFKCLFFFVSTLTKAKIINICSLLKLKYYNRNINFTKAYFKYLNMLLLIFYNFGFFLYKGITELKRENFLKLL